MQEGVKEDFRHAFFEISMSVRWRSPHLPYRRPCQFRDLVCWPVRLPLWSQARSRGEARRMVALCRGGVRCSLRTLV